MIISAIPPRLIVKYTIIFPNRRFASMPKWKHLIFILHSHVYPISSQALKGRTLLYAIFVYFRFAVQKSTLFRELGIDQISKKILGKLDCFTAQTYILKDVILLAGLLYDYYCISSVSSELFFDHIKGQYAV